MQSAPEAVSYSSTRTLGYIIAKVMTNMRLSDEDENNLYNYAEDFLRDLNCDTFPRVKEYRQNLPIKNNIIVFPKDFMGWLKIGYESGNQVVPMGNNDNLAFNDNPITKTAQDEADDITLPETFYRKYYPYEIPRTPVPTFRINYSARKIYIDPHVKIPNFYMEYQSDCLDLDKGLLIHPYYQTALQAHLYFWISMHTPSKKADAATYSALLAKETKLMRDRTAPSSLDIVTAYHRVLY